MKKKAILVLIVSIILIAATIIMESRINGSIAWQNSFIDQTEYEKLLSKRVLKNTPLVTDIYVDDQHMIYDSADNTFYCSSVEDQNFTTIYTKKNQSNSIWEVLGIDIINVRIIKDTNQLVLYNHDSISISNLVVTSLPIINVTISSDTIKDLGLDETYYIEDYTDAEIYLFDNRADFEGVSRAITSDIRIHARGGTTINLPQKSYRISLIEDKNNSESANKKENLLGLREDDDWILYSMYSDYEKIRNVFSMNLWKDTSAYNNEWNAAISNEYVYVELFFNNRYHGLYALSYPIDKKQFSLKDNESLFKKKDWSTSEYAEGLAYNDGLGYDWLAGYYLEDGPHESYTDLQHLYRIITYSTNPEEIRSAVDVNNCIDMYLFYNLTQAADNIYADKVKNLLVANKEADTEYGYKLLFCPWDLDQTWGNRYAEGQGNHGITSYHMASDYQLPMTWGPIYFLKQYGDATIDSEVKNRYQELRDTVWSDENINSLIDQYEADIYDSGAYARTMARWPDGNYYDPDVKLEDFRAFVLARFKYMDSYIGVN